MSCSGRRGIQGAARQRRFMHSRSLSVLLVLTLAFSSVLPTVSGDTVIRSETVELLPAGTFDDPSDWYLSTNKAYSNDPAEHSVSMVADGHLSFTHNRPANYDEITSWAATSPTEDNLSIGYPDCFKPTSDPVCDNDTDGDSDGGYAWTKGPIIELTTFDMSAGSNYEIVNVSLTVAFRIPDSLQQDSVQFIVESGGTQHLIKTYAHTMGELNHMNYNARVFSLDSIKTWTWSELSNVKIMLDYVSVGEFDDTELQIDAAGLIVKHLQPWGTFELAQASHQVSFDEFPVLDADLSSGTVSGMALSPCGLENSGSSSGTWVTSPFHVPYEQSWGRFHPNVVGNSSWEYSTSQTGMDGAWTVSTPISAGELIQTSAQYIRFHAALIDGCIESLMVDINDPTINIQGEIIGDAHSMVPGFAKLQIAMNGEEVASQSIATSNSSFTLSVPVGHLLTPGGGDVDIGLSTRFHWSSDGNSEDVVVQVNEMNIDGGFLIEWDRDPICDGQSDQVFEEDGGGRLLEFLYTCSDDITPNSALVVTVSSADTSILDANFINGQIRLQPIADAHGETTATVIVADERGNIWSDEIAVIITEVDDAPEMDSLPVEISMELNDAHTIPFAYWDKDTPSNSVDIQISPDWVIFSAGSIVLTPTQMGQYTISISLSDSNTVITQNVSVIVTQRADLWIQSIEILDRNTGSNSIVEGNDITITVYVRNSGNSIAQPVSIRCSVDGQTIGTPQIAMIEPGGIESTTCDDWNSFDIRTGDFTLEVEVDWTNDVDETDEDLNLWSETITVHPNEIDSNDGQGEKSNNFLYENNTLLWVSVFVLGLLGILVFMYGPNQIRKIE